MSASKKIYENLMSVWKYLPVKTRIIRKPRPVNWLVLQITWYVSIWHALLLNGVSEQTIKTLRRKQNLFICIKKNINNESGRHLWKSNVTPDSYVFPDMSLLQGRRNVFQSGKLWNIEKYLLSTPWLTYNKKFWILDKKALKKVAGHVTSDPLPQFRWPCIVIYHMKLASVWT